MFVPNIFHHHYLRQRKATYLYSSLMGVVLTFRESGKVSFFFLQNIAICSFPWEINIESRGRKVSETINCRKRLPSLGPKGQGEEIVFLEPGGN